MRYANAEWIILDLLLDNDQQQLWSIAELAREIGRPLDITDHALCGAGLIHRTTDDFVFVTRTAIRFEQLRP